MTLSNCFEVTNAFVMKRKPDNHCSAKSRASFFCLNEVKNQAANTYLIYKELRHKHDFLLYTLLKSSLFTLYHTHP